MGAHRVSETTIFQLVQSREKQDGLGEVSVSARINGIVSEVWPLLQQVSRAFPLYTLHDPEHSFRVAENMAHLVPESTLAALNSIELSVLLYCAYLHDIGMASPQEEFYKWLGSADYDAFLSRHPRWWDFVPDRDEVEVLMHKGPHEPAVAPDREAAAPLRPRMLQDAMYTEFLREGHAERGAAYILARFGATGQSQWRIQAGEVNYADCVAAICESHGGDCDSLRSSRYRRDIRIGSMPVNMQYCGVILRLADLVDLDPDRTPRALADFLLLDLASARPRPADPVGAARSKSCEEWARHRAVLGRKVTPEEIRIEAKCSQPAVQRGLIDWSDYIEQERRECMQLVRDNTRDIADRYQLTLYHEVRNDCIVSDGSYIYSPFEFRLDYERVSRLLMGTELWGDPLLAVRELLQNALDTCAHRAAVSKRRQVAYSPRIAFYIDGDTHAHDAEWLLTCEDNGMGMDQGIAENYLMQIGRSYYKSPEFQQQNLGFLPISEFGLGLMSCFMITDTLRIETQRLDPQLARKAPLLLEIDAAERYITFRPLCHEQEGTAVSLVFGLNRPGRDLGNTRRRYSPWMIREAVHFAITSFAVHLDVPITISDGEGPCPVVPPAAYAVPGIERGNLPSLGERSREFVYDYAREETGGLKGRFRFLLPLDDEGKPCLGCVVDSRFMLFIDRDGDLCFTTPDYKDKRMKLDFPLMEDWDTDELRGVYRDRYGMKPPASERYGSDGLPSSVLEIVRSSFRWSQDGLLIGELDSHWRNGPQVRGDEERERSERDNDLFGLVEIPGLNAADVDIRGAWRVKLNVQRTRVTRDSESVGAFANRLIVLSADMWGRLLKEVMESDGPDVARGLLVQFLERCDARLRHAFLKRANLPDGLRNESVASAYASVAWGAASTEES